MTNVDKYYGKYRGTVLNNFDPEQRGRIMAMIPDVLGIAPSNWALPCVPIAGKQAGTFMVPQVGAGFGWNSSKEIQSIRFGLVVFGELPQKFQC
jgi:Type VI secretion system/phage-baseplate injector OB domain